MWRVPGLVVLAAAVGLAACSENPAEVQGAGKDFPVTATWNATATPVPPSTVAGQLTIQQHLGFRMNASFTLAGAPNATYQWRIFRGDCATNVPAASATAPTGLLLYATVASYPDIRTDGSGAGSATPTIAGYLDSLTAYSVRVRPSQQSTNWNGTNPIACGDLQRTPAH
jgi:predicted small secreted protein